MGIPHTRNKGVTAIDFSRISLLRSFYVHSKYRNGAGSEPVGRKLLRRALQFCRYELDTIPALTVIADSSFTKKAIQLYAGEGGSYLGTTRDNGMKANHLMHVFIF